MMPDMHSVHTFVDWMVRASWQASVMAGLVLLCQWIFRHRLSGAWQHGLWLLVMLRLVMPGLPASHTSIFRIVPREPTSEFIPPLVPRETINIVLTPGGKPPAVGSLTVEQSPWEWQLPFAACWAAVAGALTLRLLLANRSLARRIARAARVDDPDLLGLLSECRTVMRVSRPVALLETGAVSSPAVIGVFRPRLLLPQGLSKSLCKEELRFVFLHEMAHIRRGDLAINWLLAVVRILHWFNPIIWLAVGRCRVDRELACDEMVLGSAHTASQREYGMTILKLVEQASGLAASPSTIGIVESKVQLRRRIARIASFEKKAMRWPLLGLALVLVLSSVALTEATAPQRVLVSSATASAPASQAVAPAGTSTDVQIRTYVISNILKDPDYLLGRSRPSGSALAPDEDDAEVRQRIGRPPGFEPSADDPTKLVPSERTYRQIMAHVEKLAEPSGPEASTSQPAPQDTAERRHRAAVALVDLVRQKMLTLHADSPESTAYWRQNGLALSPLSEGGEGVVVAASATDHQQICSFLEDLCEDSKINIVVECRWISLPALPVSRGLGSLFKRKDKDLEKIVQLLPKEAWETTTLQADGYSHRAGKKVAFIDDKQLEQLLKAIEADPRAITLTQPRVTLFNHQSACISVETRTTYVADFKKVTDSEGKVTFEPQTAEAPTGAWFDFSAAASRDRKNVEVGMEAKATRLVSLVDVQHEEARKTIQIPVTWQYEFKGTTAIPAGQTQVLVGGEVAGDPRDSKGERQWLILLVTPRIVATDSK